MLIFSENNSGTMFVLRVLYYARLFGDPNINLLIYIWDINVQIASEICEYYQAIDWFAESIIGNHKFL